MTGLFWQVWAWLGGWFIHGRSLSKVAGANVLHTGIYGGVLPENIMAVSDNDTDGDLLVSMPQGALRLAMGNGGSENLWANAHYIIPFVNNDGFAIALEKFMQGRLRPSW